ncbi:unnamed protein product [Allacma fusca]|uniref:Uncharacterized protein n=1 Tax=Allacma fusca TaxID=39272 RepID=A0A8J2KD55_9HEXA|nr:unnamed protein product [Allacma fusca]
MNSFKIRFEAEKLYTKEEQTTMFQNISAFINAVRTVNKSESIEAFYPGEDELHQAAVPDWKHLPTLRIALVEDKVVIIKIVIGDFALDPVYDLAEALLLFVLITHSFYTAFPHKYGQAFTVLEAFALGSSPLGLGRDQKDFFLKLIQTLPDNECPGDSCEDVNETDVYTE